MSRLPKNDKPPAIFLMGPTATGKTDLAIKLHKYLPIEIISVDSSQIYKGMDIGSAKPSKEVLDKIPHRLLDIRDPSEVYSVADFARDARKAMQEITDQGQIPILVGGAMLYFRALLNGLADNPPPDDVIRKKIEAEASKHGWPYLYSKLKDFDPDLAKDLHPNNSQRIQRALEVYYITGEIPSNIRRNQKKYGSQIKSIIKDYQIIQIALIPIKRIDLHKRIESRFTKMLDADFEAEVRLLYDRGDLHENLPAIRSAGYKQMWSYLSGKIEYNDIIKLSNAATRQLAKRQLTWLKKWPNLQEIKVDYSNQENTNYESKMLFDCLKILKRSNIYSGVSH